MKPGYTDITTIIDSSTSMFGVASETISGFNTFLSRNQETPFAAKSSSGLGECKLTLIFFADRADIKINASDINMVSPLTSESYRPNGNTALIDTVCNAIDVAGARFAAMPESERPEKVLFFIITDGQENASKKFKLVDLRERIARQQNQYKWEFMFVGANINSFSEASSYGIQAGKTLQYASNSRGVEAAWGTITKNSLGLRSGMMACMAVSQDDRDAQVYQAGLDANMAAPPVQGVQQSSGISGNN